MVAGVSKTFQVVLRSEGLGFPSDSIFAAANALVNRNAVVEGSGCCCDRQRSIGLNMGLVPSIGVVPVNCKHMISKLLSKYIFISRAWLLLPYLCLFNLYIFSLIQRINVNLLFLTKNVVAPVLKSFECDENIADLLI